MAKRRRSSDNQTGSKKKKSGVGFDGFNVFLEWEGDGAKWQPFEEESSKEILDGFKRGEKEIKLKIDRNTTLAVEVEKMVQKNVKTGFERRVRLCFNEDEGWFVWEWEDCHKIWQSYNVANSLDLEKAFQKKAATLILSALNRSYSIDLKKMTQNNDTTNMIRSIRRRNVEEADKEDKENSNGAAPRAKRKAPVKVEAEDKVGDEESVAKSRPKRAKSAAAAYIDEDDEEEEEDVKPRARAKGSKSRPKRAKSAKSKAAAEEDEEDEEVKPREEESTTRVLVMKGKAPVDPECRSKIHKAHVYYEGKDIWDCMLNQTNLKNNNNKYYLLQLLEDDNQKAYSVWFRWGRVGKSGQNMLHSCGTDLEAAQHLFMQKFQDKTHNDWTERAEFKKVPGKYDMVEIDYNAGGGEETVKVEPRVIPSSKLDKRLQDLVELICNVKAMEDAVIEMKYDAKRAPLGKLTTAQIKAGYTALKKVEKCLDANDHGQRLVQACDEFYTRIPHCFGMQRPPVIGTKAMLEEKVQLLEALSDIEVAVKVLNTASSIVNPIDRHYAQMKCNVRPVERSEPIYKVIEEYTTNTHAKTHNQYGMEVVEVFELDREGEKEQFNDVGNRQLLWHGSRMTNWYGILSQGLRIAPPEAPVTGYMFGKGVYFADMSSKSANYCFATPTKNVGFVLLSEVALGKPHELLASDYDADKLPAGCHSTKGLGKVAPDPAKNKTLPDGSVVPLGKSVNTGVNNAGGYTLNYNEFVVYNTNQVKMKYMVKVKFNFE